MAKSKETIVNGVSYPSRAAAARALGINEHTVRTREQVGYEDEELFAPVRPSHHVVEVDGHTYPSYAAAAAHYGLAESTLRTRVYHGWSIEEAVSAPPHRKKRKDAPVNDCEKEP